MNLYGPDGLTALKHLQVVNDNGEDVTDITMGDARTYTAMRLFDPEEERTGFVPAGGMKLFTRSGKEIKGLQVVNTWDGRPVPGYLLDGEWHRQATMVPPETVQNGAETSQDAPEEASPPDSTYAPAESATEALAHAAAALAWVYRLDVNQASSLERGNIGQRVSTSEAVKSVRKAVGCLKLLAYEEARAAEREDREKLTP